MDNADKKAKFALAILHKTLPHFDSGGTVNAMSAPPANQLGGSTQLQSGNTSSGANPLVGASNMIFNPLAAAGLSSNPNSVAGQLSPLMNPLGAIMGGGTNTFQAQGANLQAGTNAGQLNQAYNGAQTGLNQQQNFVNALQGQNGIQNQNANYNQLGQIASGQGPNPAAAQLAQATGANVANQAALMAGQRGSGANAGLIARQAAQQGANTQQQSAGQAATNQANQSLNAINAQTGIAQNQVNQLGQGITGQNTAQQNEQNILQQANSAYNTANVNMTSNMNNVNSATAAGNAANKQGILGGIGNVVSSIFAEGGEVEADVGKTDYNSPSDSSSSDSPPPAAAPAAASSGKSGGGLGSIIGTVAALLADGGPVQANVTGPQSKMGKALSKAASSTGTAQLASPYAANYQAGAQAGQGLANGLGKGVKALFSSNTDAPVPINQDQAGGPMDNSNNAVQDAPTTMVAAEGGKVPALVSPGEQYLPPKDVKKVVKEGKNPLAVGERIPGKPEHPGNDYRNDIVRKNLDSGGIVIPNEVMQSKNPHWEAMKFIRATMAKKRHS